MLSLILGFVLGWSFCGAVWSLMYDRIIEERIAVILMGPLVWLIVIISLPIVFFTDFYLKHKYCYVLFCDKKTKQIRVVDTRNKEECKKAKDEIRVDKLELFTLCNGYIMEKSWYNRFDYFMAKQFLGIYLDSKVMLDKKLANKVKNELK